MRKLMGLAAGAALALACAVTVPAQATELSPAAATALDTALASDIRAEDRARDAYRNPRETLAFFGVEPGMTVVDFMPAGGWYSRVLVPYLGSNGTYIGMNPPIAEDATGYFASMRNADQTFPGQVAEWVSGGGANPVGINAGSVPAEMHGTVDRIMIFRSMHSMWRFGWLRETLEDMRALLKDDGLIGVVQHRAKADAPYSYTDGSKGYLREADVIAMFQLHGFDLVSKSEVNANPNDPANHADGVWMLPPGMRGATDETRAAMQAIGESDRMTLLFRKRP